VARADAGCTVEKMSDESELCRRTSEGIANGSVVWWFQGGMEWRLREFGNSDPRRVDMKAILNAKIKRRELFRPFAPSVGGSRVRLV
jgi:carbamoyltransferase